MNALQPTISTKTFASPRAELYATPCPVVNSYGNQAERRKPGSAQRPLPRRHAISGTEAKPTLARQYMKAKKSRWR
ncbi:hypothetical protein SRO_7409 [Streptomyces rochei]|nr:hypothetical protein SRO_7409 [Streptomyces rochei]